MKTEKQIKLLTEKLARECIDQANISDKIELSGAKLEQIIDFVKTIEEPKVYPILNDGCLIIHYQNVLTVYILFSVKDEDKVNLKGATIDEEGPTSYAEFAFLLNQGNSFRVKVEGYSDAAVIVYNRQRRRDAEIEQYVKSVINENFDMVDAFVYIMTYINFLLEHPEEKQIEPQPKSTAKRNNNATPSPDGPAPAPAKDRPREIYLNGVRFVTQNKKIASALTSKKRRRITESWNVIGHYRHYKSGKVVYIKPHVRGKGGKPAKNKVIKL